MSNSAVSDDSPVTGAAQLQHAQLAYQMAVEVGQFKSGFLARTSHELRSPLSRLLSLHQLILSDLCEDPAEMREFVGQAYESAKKLLELLDEVINVSKLEHGRMEMTIETVSLNEVLLEIYSLISLPAANRNLQLQLDFPEPEIYVKADWARLKQVLLSLMDTPIHLMSIGTLGVSVSADPDTGYAYIEISDQRPASFWQEALDSVGAIAPPDDRDAAANPAQSPTDFSPTFRLWMNQTILELMQGRLDLLEVPPPTDSDENSSTTRLRCAIPLA